MQKELSYLTPEGYTVFTGQYLKNRGTCCRTGCLHCPYGFTLKKFGLQFRQVILSDFEYVDSIIAEQVDWKTFSPEHVQLIILKEKVAGVMLKNHLVVKHVFLDSHFQHQGLNKEIIESYFFI